MYKLNVLLNALNEMHSFQTTVGILLWFIFYVYQRLKKKNCPKALYQSEREKGESDSRVDIIIRRSHYIQVRSIYTIDNNIGLPEFIA